jgi:hypothetical protein
MKKFTKEYLTNILEQQDYEKFVSLHPNISYHEELLIDGSNIYSIDGTELSSEQIDMIHNITTHDYVLVYTNKRKEKQLFFIYCNGTNGYEGDVVTSLLDVHFKLSFIKNNPLVKYTTLLEYEPDHCDDVYYWFITFILK